jgi:hypothetical protein
MKPEARHYLLAGLGLILAINLIALGGVAYNRSGEAESRLLLSERELPRLNPRYRPENSAVTLNLAWRIAPLSENEPFRHGLTEAQMRQLGYVQPEPETCRPRCPREAQREVLVVLELDGPAYRLHLEHQRQRLAEAEQAVAVLPEDNSLRRRAEEWREDLRRLETDSRLYLVDVGLDVDELRQRYPNRLQYTIVKGLVRPWHSTEHGLRGSVFLRGADRINLARNWRSRLPEPSDAESQDRARYAIELSFGKRLEPWVSGVSAAKR